MLPFPMSSILTLVSPAESATGSPLLSWGPLHSCGRGRNRYIASSQAYPQSRANVTMDCSIATSLFLTTSIQPLYFQVHTLFRSGAPLSAVHSITCALFLSARGVSPSGIPIQDFSASVSPCLCGKSHVLSSLQPLVPLFALFSALPSFVFNRLQPLFPKHPGWGPPPNKLPFRISNLQTLFPRQLQIAPQDSISLQRLLQQSISLAVCFHPLTNCLSHKPFPFTTIQIARGWHPRRTTTGMKLSVEKW